MRNIFKTFKENKILLEENKLLKAQNEALTEFRKSFEDYYNDISGVKVIEKTYKNNVVLSSTITLDENINHMPVDRCKEDIVYRLSRQLMPYVEFDIVDNKFCDNRPRGTKDMIGRLRVLTRD